MASFLEKLRSCSATKREELAGELFGIEVARAAMLEMAVGGIDQITFRPTAPVDLRSTRAAVAFIKNVTDGGAHTEWKSYQAIHPKGGVINGWELLVSWGVGGF